MSLSSDTSNVTSPNATYETDGGVAVQLPERAPLLNHALPIIVALSVAYAIVFVLAVVNNSLVVTVIIRNPQMRNVTNYFLANLAVADITVSFVVLPITLLSNSFTGKHWSK